ncbi:unnamed protein product, partial [Ascophyllum nodosum]
PPAAASDDASGTARGGGEQREDLPLVSRDDLDVGEGGGGGGTFAGEYRRLETEGDDDEQQQGNADELRNNYRRALSFTAGDLSGGVGAPIGLSDLTTLARDGSGGETRLIGKKNHWFLSVKDRQILKRRTIMDRVTPLLLLSSFVADLDLVTDWYFLSYGLVRQGLMYRQLSLGFAITSTVMWALSSTEFALLSSLKNMCKGSPLDRLQPVGLGWQLLANVFLEDLPQFVITTITRPSSVSGVLNLAASGVSLVSKVLHGITSQRTPSLSTQFKMIDQDPVVSCNVFKLRDEAKQRVKLAEQLVYLAWTNRYCRRAEQKAAAVFQVMQIDPTFANGDLDYMKSDLLHGDRVYIPGRGLQGGPIPKELGTMSAMRAIILRDNELSGTISPQLGKLEALMEIDLANNCLSGTIPAEFGLLSSLRILHLQNNNLTGSIPPQLGKLGPLKSLVLAGNKLTGECTIPVELAGLGELGKMDLSNNKLTGHIPEELSNLANLEELDVGMNDLTGRVPTALETLVQLKFLRVELNMLSDAGETETWIRVKLHPECRTVFLPQREEDLKQLRQQEQQE